MQSSGYACETVPVLIDNRLGVGSGIKWRMLLASPAPKHGYEKIAQGGAAQII